MAETDPTPPDDFYDEVDEDCGNCGGDVRGMRRR